MSRPTYFQSSFSNNQQAANYTNNSAGHRGQGQQQNAPAANAGAPRMQNQPRPASPLESGWIGPDASAAEFATDFATESVADCGESASLPDHLGQTLRALRDQINAIKPPLGEKLDALVAIFASLKGDESEIRQVLTRYPHSDLLAQCQRSLTRLITWLAAAAKTSAPTSGPASNPTCQLISASMTKEQIQTFCQGLAVCLPSTGEQLFKSDIKSQLQILTDTLLTNAMAQGLPEAVQANGEVLDILNWLSRGLKAGLLEATEPINLCFKESLVLFDDWTGGDQCHQLLSDHNLGRCAVQIATILSHTGIDLRAASPVKLTTLSEQPKQSPEAERTLTYGELVQRCVLQLCAPTVLARLASAPAETVSLLNICNTVKDVIDKKLLAVTDPQLLPALNELVKVIGKLSHNDLIGSDRDCRPLSNFSNFLRTLAEHVDNDPVVLAQVLPLLGTACDHLIDCVNGDAFTAAWPGSQPLSNLISFVKICDKMSGRRAAADSAVTTTTSSTARTTSSTANQLLTPQALSEAGHRLTEGVLWYGATAFTKPETLSGLLAGLAYLWRRNLVTVAAETQALMLTLLVQVGQTEKGWSNESRRTILPALSALLNLNKVTLEQAQPALQRLLQPARGAVSVSAQQIANEIKRLGIVEEKIDALAAVPLRAKSSASTTKSATTSTATSTADGQSKVIPGLTSIQPTPLTTASITTNTSSSTTTNSAKGRNTDWQKATKTIKPVPIQAETIAHSSPTLIVLPKTNVSSVLDSPSRKPATQAANKGAQQQTRSKTDKALVKKQPTKKSTVPVSKGKGKAAPGNKLTNLSQAILKGQASAVSEQFGQHTWSEQEIVAVLHGVMNEIDLIDKKIIEALGVFFSAVKHAKQAAGTAVLKNYFYKHPTEFAGLQALLVEQNLATFKQTFETIQTAAQLLDYIDALAEDEWNDKQQMAKVSDNLERLIAQGDNMLLEAVENNRTASATRLLKLPISEKLAINGEKNGRLPLMVAVFNGNIAILKLLLAMPTGAAQTLAVDFNQTNALMYAAHFGRIDMIKLLLAMPTGAQQTLAKDLSKSNALMIAVNKQNVNIVRLLLAMPTVTAQVQAVKMNGENLLMAATQNGNADIVRMLLAKDLDGQQANFTGNEFGVNALMIAAQNGNTNIVQMLMATPTATAQAKKTDKAGKNALMAASQNGHVDIVKLLLSTDQDGQQANATESHYGVNALMFAAQYGHLEIVKLLLATPTGAAQAKTMDPEGVNALKAAERGGHQDIVQLLLAVSKGDKE